MPRNIAVGKVGKTGEQIYKQGGNTVPAAFKASGKVTLLGRPSSGGACTVQFLSSAWGTYFDISGSSRMSFNKNGSYYDIDQGVQPDFILSRPESFYDREALTEYINNLP